MNTQATIAQVLRLQTWMSSAFPIGAFTCSHGMETAIQDGRLSHASECADWIRQILQIGSGWNDAVLLNQAWLLQRHAMHAESIENGDSMAGLSDDICNLQQLNALALALQAGAERHYETVQLGASFLAAARSWPQSHVETLDELNDKVALPVVIGTLAAAHGMPRDFTLASALQSTASNLVWIATRLVPLGQQASIAIIANLEVIIAELTTKIMRTSLDDLGSCAILADMASLQHETIVSRVCRT